MPASVATWAEAPIAMWLFLKNLAFTVLVPGTVGVLIPHMLAPDNRFASLPGQLFGLLALLMGAGTYFWCLWHFARTGRGTPAPTDPPKVLVARGLYRYSRNPMYVGVLLAIVGQAALYASWRIVLYALAFLLIAHLFVLLYEEPGLKAKFGPAYERYMARVPRWLSWPRRWTSRSRDGG